MATNFIQVPPNSTGLKIDTNELTVNANTVERQSICLADPTTAANVANVVAGTNPTQMYSAVANAPVDGYKTTYSAALTALNPGTAATTDIAQIFGSASKTIRVLRVGISGTGANAAAYADTVLSVRSAAPTGGTATTATVVPYDSTDAAGTAVVKGWTAAPTAGAAVGTIAAAKLFVPVATATVIPPTLVFDFGSRPGRAVVLRGTAQGLVITFNGATFGTTAPTLDIFFEWTEE